MKFSGGVLRLHFRWRFSEEASMCFSHDVLFFAFIRECVNCMHYIENVRKAMQNFRHFLPMYVPYFEAQVSEHSRRECQYAELMHRFGKLWFSKLLFSKHRFGKLCKARMVSQGMQATASIYQPATQSMLLVASFRVSIYGITEPSLLLYSI